MTGVTTVLRVEREGRSTLVEVEGETAFATTSEYL